MDTETDKYLIIIRNGQETPIEYHAVPAGESHPVSIAIFDWEWNFKGRQLVYLKHEEMQTRDRMWWHRKAVETMEALQLDIKFDDLHLAVYEGDHNPTEEHINDLKGRTPNIVQYHNGQRPASEYLPKEERT